MTGSIAITDPRIITAARTATMILVAITFISAFFVFFTVFLANVIFTPN